MIKPLLERIQWLLELFFWSSHYHSTAIESKALINNGPAILKSAVIENNGATALFLQVFDLAAEPAGGTTPLLSLTLPGNTTASFIFNQKLNTGIYVALSTTQFTYTDAAATASLNVEYKTMVN